jgi:Site-specific DNA methylase
MSTTVQAAARRAARAIRVASAKLGLHRGNKRLYLQGKYLVTAGFAPSSLIEAEFERGRVTLRTSPRGTRRVAGKADGSVAVIDVNCAALAEAFGNVETVVVKVFAHEIVITTALRERRRAERCRNGKEASLCSGVGLLSLAAHQAGYEPSAAIELDQRYADIYQQNFPRATVYNMALEDVDVSELEGAEVLTMGLDCSGISRKRTVDRVTGAKRDRKLPPEAHPQAGVLPMFAAAVVERVNPRAVIVEEGELWLNSASGWMMRYFLERLGYFVDARVIDPREYGYLQGRKRTVMIANSDERPRWPLKAECSLTVADILDPEEQVEGAWFDARSKAWLHAHWSRHDSRGNGFRPTPILASDRSTPTLGKRYLAVQGDSPVLAHPTKPGVLRHFTLSEIRRLFTVPESFILGGKTVSGEGVCQGVIVDLFRRIVAAATGRGGEDVEPIEEEHYEAAAGGAGAVGQIAFGF